MTRTIVLVALLVLLGAFGVACGGGGDDDVPERLIFISRKDGDYTIRLNATTRDKPPELDDALPWDTAPNWSPDGSQITFYGDRVFNLTNADDNVDIYVMAGDGSTMTRLTDTARPDAFPVWSPDGTRIAFYSERDGNGEIYSMAADGSDVRRLTERAGVDFPYAYSPDGSKMLFGSNAEGNFDVYVMDVDGGDIKRLTSKGADEFEAAWSPDGTRIVYQSGLTAPDVYLMNADGSNEVNMTVRPLGDSQPRWSPDGGRIAFVTRRDDDPEVYVIDAAFSELARVTEAPRDEWDPLESTCRHASLSIL